MGNNFIDDIFKDAPAGDFVWKDDLPSFSIPEQEDGQWREISYAMDVGRKDGKRFIEIHEDTCGEGDWTPDLEWHEGEDTRELEDHCMLVPDSHKDEWAKYYQYVAETGEDPLNRILVKTHREYTQTWIAEVVVDYLPFLNGRLPGAPLMRVRREHGKWMKVWDAPLRVQECLNARPVDLNTPRGLWVTTDLKTKEDVEKYLRPRLGRYYGKLPIIFKKPRPESVVRRERIAIAKRNS